MRIFSFRTAVALGVAVICLSPAFAQEEEKNEAGGFAGLVHNKEANEFVVGGGYTRTLSSHFAFDTQLDYSRSTEGEFTRNSYLWAAGPQFLIPTHSKIKPYVGAGLGVLHESESEGILGTDSVNKFAAECGGGIRVDFSKRWGFDPEFKVIKAADLPVFVRATFGIFYRF